MTIDEAIRHLTEAKGKWGGEAELLLSFILPDPEDPEMVETRQSAVTDFVLGEDGALYVCDRDGVAGLLLEECARRGIISPT